MLCLSWLSIDLGAVIAVATGADGYAATIVVVGVGVVVAAAAFVAVLFLATGLAPRLGRSLCPHTP